MSFKSCLKDQIDEYGDEQFLDFSEVKFGQNNDGEEASLRVDKKASEVSDKKGVDQTELEAGDGFLEDFLNMDVNKKKPEIQTFMDQPEQN